jgi:hypothetical protein
MQKLIKPLEAVQNVVDGIHLSRVLNRGACGIDGLFRFGLEGTALRSLEYVLAKTDPNRESLHELTMLLSKHNDMRSAMLGEIVYAKHWFEYRSGLSMQDMKAMLEWCDSPFWELVGWYAQFLTGLDRIHYAYEMGLLRHVVENWNNGWQDFMMQYEQHYNAIPLPYRWSVAIADTYTMLKRSELKAAGYWNCGLIAVAIEMYAQKHGRLPERLDELVPGYLDTIPAEPFYGKPFEYETDGSSGTLSFAYPDSGEEDWGKGSTYTFRVFANRESAGQRH